MNSKELRKKFKPVYTDFFSRCSTVVSAPHSFLWSGDFSGFYGGLTISSKIPLRFYLGLEETGGQEIEVSREMLAYYPEKATFAPLHLDEHLVQSIAGQLKELRGKKIHLLSEVPLGSSLGGLGALAACMALMLNHESGIKKSGIDSRLRGNDRTGSDKNNLAIKPPEGRSPSGGQFSNLFPKAWEIAKKLQTGRTLGATAYAALSDSNYPIAFYAQGTKHWAKPLNQITRLDKDPVWPIDFGLVFSGKLVQGAAVIANVKEIKRLSEEREAKIDFRRMDNNPFWTDYLNFLKQIANQNLYAFCDLFQKGAHESTLKYFFSTLNQYQNLLHFLEISNPEIDKIYSNIHTIANISENRVGSGAKITGVGKGGMVLFATPYGQYREALEKDYEQSLVYASWRDASNVEAAKIEQDISSRMYSDFIDKDAYLLHTYQQEIKSLQLVTKDNISRLGLDLIIDAYQNKIIIPGRELNSKDLPSQKSASIILYALLKSDKNRLSNKELPGSYATSRFDLQSKITSPLNKLCGLDFEISGGMYDEFSLTLKRLDIKVGVLEKI